MRLFLLLLLSYVLFACTSGQEVQGITPIQVDTTSASNFVAADYINKPISVTIEKGEADFHNIDGFAAYQPIVVFLKNGEVVTKSLTKTGNNFFDSNAKITLRYYNGLLYIDEVSREDIHLSYAGLTLPLNEGWLKGQVYMPVNTEGFSRLRNAVVTVRIDQ